MSLPTVAIVGRPNVGKSSLFNRFLQRRLAVVDAVSGVTRDRNYAVCDWNGIAFRLVDTGGMVPESDDEMERLIFDQAEFALNEADLILFVVDTQAGPDPIDSEIARSLHKAARTCIVVANKADNETLSQSVYDFYKLGLGEPRPVSATTGLGIGDMLDALVERLPEQATAPEVDNAIRVAVVGRPNVGKSSFINKLLGEDRLIVSPIAGTTRDSVDTLVQCDGRNYILVDTAGLRRRYRVHENIEFYTTVRTDRAIDDCDVAVVLIDAVDGLTVQDQRVLSRVLEARRAAVLAVNKWDLVEKETGTTEAFTREIEHRLAQMSFLPIVFISAATGQRLSKVMTLISRVYEQHHRRIDTPELNEFLQRAFERRKPPARERRYIQMKYIAQTEVAPPTFVIFTNHPKLIDKSYINYLHNQIRAEYGFEGVPIRLKFRRK